MTEYTAQCRHDAGQYLKAYINGISVIIDGYDDRECVTNPYLSADSARIFARGILALADEIDGGEVTEVDIRPKVGDRLRVTEDYPNSCPVVRGDIITVVETDYDDDPGKPDFVRFLNGGDPYRWYISLDAVEPVEERELLETSEPARSSRATYVEEDRRLMDGTGADADHIIAVAQFLAADE